METSTYFKSLCFALLLLFSNSLIANSNKDLNPKDSSVAITNKTTGSFQANFDGVSNYIDLQQSFHLNSDFTFSAWILRTANKEMNIFSKRNDTNSDGYEISLNAAGQIKTGWKNGTIVSANSEISIPMNEWHHISVTCGNNMLKIFVDGIEVANTVVNVAAPLTDYTTKIGAGGNTSVSKHFQGKMDEIRIWSKALTASQIQFMMNQEIENNSGSINGKIIPSGISKHDISGLTWSDLEGYFTFSEVNGNSVKNNSGNTQDGIAMNMDNSSFEIQTAPIPYVTKGSGNWDNKQTWMNGEILPIPGSISIADPTKTTDWNVVVVNHHINLNNSILPATCNGNRTIMALEVNNKTLTVEGDNDLATGWGLNISHYLKLNGTIKLQGESQLIQHEGSDLDPTSIGIIQKDQQGTADLYTYNYWSSPVSISNTNTNNNGYTLSEVMKDGDQAVNFLSSGYDGTNTTPVGIADYWIWKFATEHTGSYSSWQHVRSHGTINAGEGFTMKGPGTGSISEEQNYTFEGKPNNGVISLNINAYNDLLVGNPYPSAIDADKFIMDNSPINSTEGATSGTLYFWEHYGGGSHSHNDYQGGYAIYNLSGGVSAPTHGTQDPNVATGNIPNKTPGRYIAVSQGFFVKGNSTGTVEFNNSQRVFQKEGDDSEFLKSNQDVVDNRMKIRLGMNSVNGIHRQLLVTLDENATTGVDAGFDGHLLQEQMDDFYWMINGERFIIQGTNSFAEEMVLPLGLHTQGSGLTEIKIDALENAETLQNIFLHDKVTGVFHDLQLSPYQVVLNQGMYADRFELTFTTQETLSNTEVEFDGFDVSYSNTDQAIIMNNPKNKELKSIEMYNILGQQVYLTFDVNQRDFMKLPVSDLSTGAYIIKVNTPESTMTKKVLVK